MPVVLYHFTHVANLESIVSAGALFCDHRVQHGDTNCTDVGDYDVKARRRRMVVDCGPRGVVADYVPFYFAPRSPMLFVINNGRVPQYQEGQEPLVYLVTDVDRLVAQRRQIVFTDGNAASALTGFFEDPADLAEEIDWDLMQARYWNNTLTQPDRMRRRMAEALVHNHVPWPAFTQCATIDEAMARRVRRVLQRCGTSLPVSVQRAWYY